MRKDIGFCDAFRDADRNDNFSYDGKQLLFDYLEQMSEDTGLEYCLDVIALCCEFLEMGAEEVASNYGLGFDACCRRGNYRELLGREYDSYR